MLFPWALRGLPSVRLGSTNCRMSSRWCRAKLAQGWCVASAALPPHAARGLLLHGISAFTSPSHHCWTGKFWNKKTCLVCTLGMLMRTYHLQTAACAFHSNKWIFLGRNLSINSTLKLFEPPSPRSLVSLQGIAASDNVTFASSMLNSEN